jgi:thioesterase domain-containing protein
MSSRPRRVRAAAMVLVVTALAGCAAHPESVAPPTLELVCEGEGTPAVVLAHGLNGAAGDFASLQHKLADETQVCSYSRAGLGQSAPWPQDVPDPSAGAAADQLRATLEENGVPGPYVVLGWSYGGIVAQAFAARHRDALAGLILEDPVTRELFRSADWDRGITWAEGGRSIDTETTFEELDELMLDRVPLIILTQGRMHEWPDPSLWMQTQEELATLSDNAVHLIATDIGHGIHWEAEALVVKAVTDVVEAVRADEPLPDCDDAEWAPLGAECGAR